MNTRPIQPGLRGRLLAVVLLLSACGGGGGGSAPPVQQQNALVWGQGNWGERRWSAPPQPLLAHSEDGKNLDDLNARETNR